MPNRPDFTSANFNMKNLKKGAMLSEASIPVFVDPSLPLATRPQRQPTPGSALRARGAQGDFIRGSKMQIPRKAAEPRAIRHAGNSVNFSRIPALSLQNRSDCLDSMLSFGWDYTLPKGMIIHDHAFATQFP